MNTFYKGDKYLLTWEFRGELCNILWKLTLILKNQGKVIVIVINSTRATRIYTLVLIWYIDLKSINGEIASFNSR